MYGNTQHTGLWSSTSAWDAIYFQWGYEQEMYRVHVLKRWEGTRDEKSKMSQHIAVIMNKNGINTRLD